MKLDKTVEPLATDTTAAGPPALRARPEVRGARPPARAKATFKPGDTVPLKQASEPLEFEDVFSTFDRDTRAQIAARHARASATRSPAAASR